MSKLILSAALLIVVSAPALAQDAEREGKCEDRKAKHEARFNEMDADASGTLSLDEVDGRMADHFDEIDTDADGELTKDELRTFGEARRAERGEKGEGKGKRGEGKGRREGRES